MIQDIRSARHRLFQRSLMVMQELDKSLAMSPPQVREQREREGEREREREGGRETEKAYLCKRAYRSIESIYI